MKLNDRQLIYQDLAIFYDGLYRWKDYKKEAEELTTLISQHKACSGNNLLDVGCGTGKHIKYLKKSFSCTGIDLNKEMTAIAQKEMPEISFQVADMVDFELTKKFDVITCLFSGIGCVKTYNNVKKVFTNFIKHLNYGGVVIVEPWLTKSSYKIGLTHLSYYENEEIKVAQMNLSKLQGDMSVIEMHYLISDGKEVRHVVDYDIEGLFEVGPMLKIMEEIGFQAKYLPNGLGKDDVGIYRGLFLGVSVGSN